MHHSNYRSISIIDSPFWQILQDTLRISVESVDYWANMLIRATDVKNKGGYIDKFLVQVVKLYGMRNQFKWQYGWDRQVTKNKVVRFNLTIRQSGRLWMTYLGYSIQSGLKRSGWNLTNLTSGYGPAFNVLVWCNSKYYWLSQCFPTFFNSCTPWCLKIWWCTPRTYLSLEDSTEIRRVSCRILSFWRIKLC